MAAYAIQFRRGTTTQHNSFTGLMGEVTVDTDKKTLVVHDGSTVGGFPLAREGAASSASSGTFTSNVAIGGTLSVNSTSSFNGDVTIIGDLGMTGHIIPSANITYDLGSPTMMWRDAYIGPGSLYINGSKVLEDSAGTIRMSADTNQNIKVETLGTGALQLVGSNGIQIQGSLNSISGDIQIGDHIDMNGSLIKQVATPVSSGDAANKSYVDAQIVSEITGGTRAISGTTGTFSSNVTIGGNLTINGTTTTINTQTLSVADNIIDLNSDFTSGTPSENAGIRVLRGDDVAVQVRWNETLNQWQFTNNGSNYYAMPTSTGDLAEGTNLYWTSARGDANFATNIAAADTGDLAEGTNLYWTSARGDANFATNLAASTTDGLGEGSTNLYFTNARVASYLTANSYATQSYVDSAVAGKDQLSELSGSTDDVAEGSTNLYFTNARARNAISVSGDLSYDAATGVISTQGLASSDTSDLAEGSNLYFTDARARAAISVSGDLGYNATTGVLSFTERTDAEVRGLISVSGDLSYNNGTGVLSVTTYKSSNFDTDFGNKSTDNLGEGSTNLYFTTARAQAAVSGNITSAVSAATTSLQSYADQAEADAISTAAADATSKADAALVDAKAYTDGRETAITTAYTGSIATSKAASDAYADAAEADAKTYADGIVATEATARADADAALDVRVTATEDDIATLQTSVANVISNTDAAALDSLTEIVAAFQSADGNLNSAITTLASDATSARSTLETSLQAYADQAELDAIASAKTYTDGRETAITTAYTSAIATSKTASDAYADQAEADAKAYADGIVSAETTARSQAVTSAISTAAADATSKANTAKTEAIAAAALDATSKADAVETAANAYADGIVATEATARANAVTSAISTASTDATSKANAALVDAKAYTDDRETAITTAYTSAIATAVAGKDNTDEITEGSSNLYFTDARARAAISVSGDLSYNATTGVISTQGLASSTTDDLSEGTTNLYWTSARGDANFATNLAAVDSDDLSEGTTNLYFTNARAQSAVAGDISSAIATATTSLQSYADTAEADAITSANAYTDGRETAITSAIANLSSTLSTTSNVQFNDLVLTGDLTVSGTVTTINTETIELADNIILLNSNAIGVPTQSAGFEIHRGSETNVQFVWDEANDRWTFGALDVHTSGAFVGNVTGQVSDISNHDTDDLVEGTNLYFTTARARGAVVAGGSLSYNESTGVFSYTERTDSEIRGLLAAGGDISYNATTGEFSFTQDMSFNSLTEKPTTVAGYGITNAYTMTEVDNAISAAVAGKDQLSELTGTTDDVTEGSTNVYFTDARARAAISVSGDLSYNETTGVISFTNDAGDISSVTAGNGLSGGGVTGDVTLAVNVDRGLSIVADNVGIADTAVTAGSYGAADSVSSFTVNTRGQLTAAGQTAISIVASQVSDFNTAVKDAISMTHSSVYTVSTAAATANSGANPEFSWATLGFNLSDKDMYSVYLNRLLLRPTEYLVSSTGITFDQFILSEDDEIEAVMLG